MPVPAADAKLEALWEFLTLSRFDDGSPRETGTVLIFHEEGHVKACVIDREHEVTAFVAASSIRAVLERIDRGVREDKLDWRKRKGDKPKGRK